MAEMSNHLENALINAVLRNTSYTSPTTTYLALYTSDPTDADTGTEITGGSYVRQAILQRQFQYFVFSHAYPVTSM